MGVFFYVFSCVLVSGYDSLWMSEMVQDMTLSWEGRRLILAVVVMALGDGETAVLSILDLYL